MTRPILIASTSADAPTYGPVVDDLSAAGASVVVVEVDKIASGAHEFEFLLKGSGSAHVRYRDRIIDINHIGAAWYRHPDLFGYDLSDRAKQMCLAHEACCLLDAFWASIPDDVWLNSPRRLERAQIKLLQLTTAATLGFDVPTTLVTNSWDSIAAHFESAPVVVKMTDGLLYDGTDVKSVYTTILGDNAVRKSSALNPFPAIFQSYLGKLREWRVTIVGDRTFSARIHTTAAAKVDWRRHQLTDDVSFEAAQLPADVEACCRRYLEHYELRFGAFDLVEEESGRFVFLELNPNGQYLWLEKRLGMTISATVASELLRIAKLRSGDLVAH